MKFLRKVTSSIFMFLCFSLASFVSDDEVKNTITPGDKIIKIILNEGQESP